MKLQREVVGMDGIKRTYTFDPLTVGAAADVEHELWEIATRIGGNLGESAMGLFSQVSTGGLSAEDFGACLGIPSAVLRAIPKDDLKRLANSFLSGAVVDDPNGEVHTLANGWTDDYFRGRWPERIDAILMAIDVSFPGYFSQALAYLKGFAVNRLGLTFSTVKKGESATE